MRRKLQSLAHCLKHPLMHLGDGTRCIYFRNPLRFALGDMQIGFRDTVKKSGIFHLKAVLVGLASLALIALRGALHNVLRI
jgi:hypothetical protein